MAGTHTLVLGAGFGGLECATTLAQNLPDGHRVTLVDARPSFLMGLAKLQMIDGRRGPDEGARAIRDVARLGVDVREAKVTAIDVAARTATVGGEDVAWDHLVVALGAGFAPERIPGLAEAGRNLYSRDEMPRLHEDLARFEGGDVLFLVTAMPFKCPPAPYEAAMLASAFLRGRGVDANVTVCSPEPQPLPVAGPECGDSVREWADERGVTIVNGVAPERVDPDARTVTFRDGTTRSFDLLAYVAPHVPPRVLAESGLVDPEKGWVPADPLTLATRHENVWAIGDCNVVPLANGKPLVMAGVMAEGEGRVVAENIVARVKGEEPTARFEGKGSCFLELGDGLAVEVKGDFLLPNGPVVAATPPSADALERKHAYERDTMTRWFGPA